MAMTTRQKAQAATFTLISQPASVQGSLFTPKATTPQQPTCDWAAKQAERLERFKDRVRKILRRWKVKANLISRYPIIVKRRFSTNVSDVASAQDLVDAEKAAVRAAKKWWKTRPKTCDDRIARKFAKCRSMPMFTE